jgi:hypothetical protein
MRRTKKKSVVFAEFWERRLAMRRLTEGNRTADVPIGAPSASGGNPSLRWQG